MEEPLNGDEEEQLKSYARDVATLWETPTTRAQDRKRIARFSAAKNYAEDNEAERTRWQQKVERARYEVKLAQRQYDAADPDNRLVTRELERRFE